MKHKILAVICVYAFSFNASAKMIKLSGLEQGDMLDLNVVKISKVVKEQQCQDHANDEIREMSVVVSEELTKIKSLPTFVVGMAVESSDAGFNHWKYACEDTDKVEVIIEYSASFVLSGSPESIAMDVPDMIGIRDVSIEKEPQPMYMPAFE